MSALAQWSTVDPGNMSDVDLHIQQTNDRLQCIQQHLLSPSSYPSAARELLEWCSDTRAFQWQFEQRLMACLTVVSQVAGQFGYDLDLGYRLLAVCAAHRDKLTPKSAGLLSVWCEELGRLLLLRHHKVDPNNTANTNNSTANNNNNNNNNSNTCGMQMQMPMMQNHVMLQNSSPEMLQQWSSVPQPQKSLSVVTTVWGGMTPTSQTSPYSNTRMPGAYTNKAMYNSSVQPGFNAASPPMQKQSPYNSAAMSYNRQTSGTGYNQQNGFSSGSVGSRMNCTQGGSASPDTLSGAGALASGTASAAVTATASAAVICMEEGSQPKPSLPSNQYAPQMSVACPQQYGRSYNSNPSNCYGSLHPGPHSMHGPSMGGPGGQALSPVETGVVPPPMHCGPMPCGGQVPMKGGSMVMQSGGYGPQRRPAPYPNPQQYMQSKRGPYPNGPQGVVSEGVFGIQSYGMASQYGWNKPGFVHSQQPMPMANYGSSSSGQPNGPYCGGQSRFMQPGMGGGSAAGGQCRPSSLGYNSQFNSPMQNYPMSNMTSPIFDNLTPPMTPATMTSAPPYVSLSVDPLPNKPMMVMKANSEDLRLTFPVRDGVVLPSFRLEHNLAVSNHVFHLRDSVYQTLMWRPDLELQLKCFHHEDHQMNTNWPASVTVSVNATPLTIERGDNKSIHRPLYLKDVCQPGRNTIQITVTACCCSHLFVLQLVHRPSVKSVLQGLLRKRLLPAEHCITKIKRSFMAQPVTHSSQTLREEGVEQTAIKVSLKCPITYQYIALPVRGHDCKHIQCFDLESYLRLNCDRGTWRCPICNKPALLEGLEIDQYIWGILQTLAGTQFEEVTVDTTASWKPVPVKTMKEEDKDLCIQRWKKAISPSSMKLPTMNTWQDSSFSTSNSSQPLLYPISPQGQSFYNSPNGSQYGDGQHLGANPCFPPSSSPDFLSSLSQMGDSLLCPSSGGGGGGGGGVTGGDGEKTSTAIHQYAPRLDTPLMHPPTPLDGQGSLPRTPINGQSGHPHTPLDVHGSYSDSHLGPPGTPLDGQQGSMKLRHATPGTPSSSSVGNPHTPSNASASCGGSVGPPTHNSSSSSSSSYDPTLTGTNGTHDSKGSQAPSSNDCFTQSSGAKAAESDLSLGLAFDPASMMDSDSQSQEVLDLLPDNIGDPTELLSYLGPMDNACNGENNNGNNNDDLLSLFS